VPVLIPESFFHDKLRLAPSGHSVYNTCVILDIVKYGHPVLRQQGKRIDTVTPELRQFAQDMLDTMYARDGVGLAAQQVNRAILMTVIDVTASEQPSEIIIDGQPQPLAAFMPLTLLNPVVSHPEGEVTGSEGCLSFPEINADIRRALKLTVQADTLDGRHLKFQCTGLLARAMQHELDHLNGILFIDRMDAATKASLSGKLRKLQKETLEQLKPRRKTSKFALLRR
jgi:peptide deformylase